MFSVPSFMGNGKGKGEKKEEGEEGAKEEGVGTGTEKTDKKRGSLNGERGGRC